MALERRRQGGVQACRAVRAFGVASHVRRPGILIGTRKYVSLCTYLEDSGNDGPIKVTIVLKLFVHTGSDLEEN